jgi:iron complex outermembrane receptor protein
VLASYANYDDARVQGMVNVPLGDWLKARVVLDWNRRGDGFVKNIIAGGQGLDRGQTFSGRVRFDMELAPNFDLSLSTTFLDGSGPSQYFVLHNQPTAPIVSVNPALAAASYSFEPWRTSANDPVNTDRRLSMTSATATWSLGDVTLKSISAYTTLRDDSLADDDGIDVSIFPVRRFYDSKSFSQEVNAALSLDALDLVTGLYYLKDSYQHILDYDLLEGVAPLSPAGLPPGSDLLFDVRDYDTSVKAAFADITVRPVANLSLIAGIRYSEERQTQVQQNSISIGNIATILTCPLMTNEAKFNSTTPRFGARYEFSSDVNAYATFSKGYKAGGYNLNACDNRFNPEKLNTYEGGVKTRLLDRTLTLNLSAFYYDYSDLQISQVIGLARFINNAAAATIKGAELEADWQPSDHWSINANATYLDARYESFSNTDGLDPAAGVQILDGHRLNEAPKFSANLGVAYRTAASSSGRFTLRTDVSYRSKYYLREFNGPLDTQNAFALINSGLIWDSPQEQFRVRLFVNNLTNKAYIAKMDSSDNFGARFISWNTPRQYGIELRSNF